MNPPFQSISGEEIATDREKGGVRVRVRWTVDVAKLGVRNESRPQPQTRDGAELRDAVEHCKEELGEPHFLLFWSHIAALAI